MLISNQAPVNTFADLPVGANLDSTTIAHPAGVQVISNGAVWWMDNNGRRGFSSGAQFNSYGYMFSHVVAANSYDLSSPNLGDVPNRAACTGGGGSPPPPPVSGSMTVTLATDNPASRAVVTNEGQADLAHFTFWGNAVVNSVTLKRIGVSADTSLGNVYLFDGATRITDASSVSSGSLITFNSSSGLFTVNGSKTISVRADMAASAGETVGIQLVSAMAGSVAFTGVPITGNSFTIATATLATVALGAGTVVGATDPGTGVLLWQSTATVGIRDVLLTRLALRNIGSISSSDINNFTLYVDGVSAATTASLDSNGYVTFNLSKALLSGSRVLKVTGDIIGGSSRTVQFSLRGAYDISTTDTQYNAGVLATGTFPIGSTVFTVNPGSMTVVKAAASGSTNLTLGASDQSFATFTFTAHGESIKVENLKVGVITNGTPANILVRNVKLFANGGQVGATTNVRAQTAFTANQGTQFTTNFTVTPGTPTTVEIRGDVVDADITTGTATDDFVALNATTLQAQLVGGAGRANGTPLVSITPIDVPTSANTAMGNTRTIASGSISLAKTSSYGTQTVVVPATAFKIGSFQLTGNATEPVNINTLDVSFIGNSGTVATDLSDLYVVYGGTQSSTKGTVSAVTNVWSVNFPLAVNQTMQVDVFATIASTLGVNNIIPSLAVTGVTANSTKTVYADSVVNPTLDAGLVGQTINGGTGTISVDSTLSPNPAIVDDSGNVISAVFKFAAGADNYTVTDMTLTVADTSAVSTVTLVVNGTPVVGGSLSGGSLAAGFHGLNIPVLANGHTDVTVQLAMSGVAGGAGLTGGALLTTLTAATVRSSGGANSTPSGLPAAGNAMYVYHAFPTITNLALPSSVLAAGTGITLAKFSIASNGGPIEWAKLLATVTVVVAAADDAVTLPTLWDVTTGTAVQVTTTGSYVTGLSNASGTIVILPNIPQTVSGSKTYELRATLAGTFVTATDSIQTNITLPALGFLTSLQAFKTVALTGPAYFDLGGAPTAVATNDIRMKANVSVASAYDNTVNTGLVTFDAGTGDGADEVKSYGTVTSLQTIVLTETTTTSNVIGVIGGTLVSAGGFTCTAKDTAEGLGAATTTVASIESIVCVNATTNSQVVLILCQSYLNGGLAVSTITLTTSPHLALVPVGGLLLIQIGAQLL